MLYTLIAAFYFVALAYSIRNDYSPKALQSQIKSLPGLPSNANFTMFSGYIDVNPSNPRYIFYWFVESLNKPATDPVFFWTNGGPGCSGLGGFFTEQGPFRVLQDQTLELNPHTWVNVANGIFVEQPAGVGFSYAENPAETGDSQAALDNYNFIRGWLELFTNYQNNDFYITSESYGGHYMPTLAKQIVEGNNQGNTPQINFKGVFVGNPYTDPHENAKGMYDTWYGHQMVSYPSWNTWFLKCDDGDTSNVACDNAIVALNDEIGGVDPYALDYPVCNDKLNQYWFLKKVVRDMLGRPLPKQYEEIAQKHDAYSEKMSAMSKEEREAALKSGEFPDPTYQQCAQAYATEYLNRPDVQEAIYVQGRVIWTDCSDTINYNRSDGLNPMEPVWQWLVSNSNLRMTVVSGDDDSVCGTIGTQSWIWNMGYQPVVGSNWKSWQLDNQVAGFYTAFNTDTKASFCFSTVHSAGHMIPQTQPQRSLAAFTNFLTSQFCPSPN